MSVADGGDPHGLTTARDHVTGNPELTAWAIDGTGMIELRGQVLGEEFREVAVGNAMLIDPTTRQQAVAAVCDHQNYIKVISWELGIEQ